MKYQIKSFYHSETITSCDNCYRVISNIAVLVNPSGKLMRTGVDCAIKLNNITWSVAKMTTWLKKEQKEKDFQTDYWLRHFYAGDTDFDRQNAIYEPTAKELADNEAKIRKLLSL